MGAPWTPPPRVLILPFSCSSKQKICKINNRLAHPLWELAPPSGTSWIRHCLCKIMAQVPIFNKTTTLTNVYRTAIFLFLLLEDIGPFREAIGKPVLDFCWRLPWVSRAPLVRHLLTFCNLTILSRSKNQRPGKKVSVKNRFICTMSTNVITYTCEIEGIDVNSMNNESSYLQTKGSRL